MKQNFEIHQVPHGYSFILGFYGRCEDGTECDSYDINQPPFRRVVDSVYQVSGQQSGTTFAWYKSDLVETSLNHFDKLECGHLYYFVVKPGDQSVEVPHLYITNNSSSQLYEFDDTGRVTSDCKYVPPTPTPEPDCCGEFSNSLVTLGTPAGTDNLNGVKAFGFEYAGMFCYDTLGITNFPGRYNFKTDQSDSILGYITTTGYFTNKSVRYVSATGTCYHGLAETQNGFNILTKR